jgi:transposase
MFFFYIYEKGLTAGKAVSLINIPHRTGYNWLQEDQKNLIDRLEGKVDDDDNLTENRGRKKLLTADHKRHLEETFGENSSTTIDQAMDSLTNNFEGLKISKQTVRNFMVDECALSFKKLIFTPQRETLLRRFSRDMSGLSIGQKQI